MSLYDQDFYQWTQEQAALLKAGALAQLDVGNLIEEVESMGRSEKRELVSRLSVLIMHMLKKDYQPTRQTRSWTLTIDEQRARIRTHLRDNPSLKSALAQGVEDAYELAIFKAMRETNLNQKDFPKDCPYSIERILGE